MKELIEKKLANARADLEKTQEEISEMNNFVIKTPTYLIEKEQRLIGCIETHEDLLHTKELSEVEKQLKALEIIKKHIQVVKYNNNCMYIEAITEDFKYDYGISRITQEELDILKEVFEVIK